MIKSDTPATAMPTGAQLLDRLTTDPSSYGPILTPLGSVLTPLARSFWPRGVKKEPIRLTPDHCRVIGPEQVAPYHFTGSEGWSSYEAIAAAFDEQRKRLRETGAGAKTSELPRSLVDADLKLVIRDRPNPIQCMVTWSRVYPRRAWVGTLHDHLSNEWAFVIAALLNSSLGHALYRRLARGRKDRPEGTTSGRPC
jgi:hypothetical protein